MADNSMRLAQGKFLASMNMPTTYEEGALSGFAAGWTAAIAHVDIERRRLQQTLTNERLENLLTILEDSDGVVRDAIWELPSWKKLVRLLVVRSAS